MNATVEPTPWGTLPDGTAVPLYTMHGADGTVARVTPWGATLVSLDIAWSASSEAVDRRPGKPLCRPAILRLPDFEAYRANPAYLGALIGPFANRIRDRRFTLHGREWVVEGSGRHHLHGGPGTGFSHRLWRHHADGRGVSFTTGSAPRQGGFPGPLAVSATYRLVPGALELELNARTTGRGTPLNLAHHPYFRLGDTPDVSDHRLTVHGDRVLQLDEDRLPTGRLLSVADTPFDLREGGVLGRRVGDPHPQVAAVGGFDHSWLVSGPEVTGADPTRDAASPRLRRAATLTDEATGRTLHIDTSLPVLHCFTPGGMADVHVANAAGGIGPVPPLGGVALECQHPPDAPNQPHFPSTLLRPDAPYAHRIVYRWA